MLDEIVAPGGKTRTIESALDSGRTHRLLQPEGIGEEFEEFADAHILVDASYIRQIAKRRANRRGVRRHVVAGNSNGARISRKKGGKDLDESGFPSPVGADESDEFIAFHLQRKTV